MEQVAPTILSNVLQVLNNSKLFSAAIMIVMNLGSKYISIDMCNFHEKILSSFVVRKIAVFAIFWMATKDIILSFILMIIFSIVMSGLLNENSRFCIIPNKEQFIQKEDKKKISAQEYENAQKIIKSYSEQKTKTEHFENEHHQNDTKQKNIYKNNKDIIRKSFIKKI
jgi:hypothetical protein